VEDGLAAWGGGEAEDRALIVRGRESLEDAGAVEDLERVRSSSGPGAEGAADLPAGRRRDGQGVRIFIGAETRLFSLSGSAVIAAPYMTGAQRVLGAIGVIGPARLNYARIIPLVDYTARVLGQVMNA
jgi:heat-inducible transcriptional repressor